MVHGDESPVCDDTSDAEGSVWVGPGDEVFNRSGVEKLDVGEGEDFGEEGGGEECLSRTIISIFLDSDMKRIVERTACFTTTKSPSSSNGTPRSIKNASAGLRITIALKSWPPSQAPPPGETEASMMAILRSGRALPSM